MKLHLLILGLLTFLTVCSAIKLRSEEHIKNRDQRLKYIDRFAAEFAVEYKNYTDNGVRSTKLDQMFQISQLPADVGRFESYELPPDAVFVSCLVCRAGIASLVNRYRNGERTREETEADAVDLCMQWTPFGIVVCQGVVDLNADIMFHIIDNRPALTPNAICSMVFPTECGDPDPMFNFAINVSPGPPISGPKTESVPRNPNEWKVLHISDPHYDPVSIFDYFRN